MCNKNASVVSLLFPRKEMDSTSHRTLCHFNLKTLYSEWFVRWTFTSGYENDTPSSTTVLDLREDNSWQVAVEYSGRKAYIARVGMEISDEIGDVMKRKNTMLGVISLAFVQISKSPTFFLGHGLII